MTSRITGTGSCLADVCVTNDWLSGIMDTSDEWIRTRTGIRERHLAKEMTTTDMAYEAAVQALSQAGVAAEDLDLIVVGTVTADHVTPSAACELQARLGADHAMAFDINGACSGFLFAIETADAFLQTGRFKNALVLGAESLSRIMDWSDRSGATGAPACCSGTARERRCLNLRKRGSWDMTRAATERREARFCA